MAATATIPWIFQFAKDQQMSSNADRDLGTCARFLGRAAANWPSISQKSMLKLTAQDFQENINSYTYLSLRSYKIFSRLQKVICRVAPTKLQPYASSHRSFGNFSIPSFSERRSTNPLLMVRLYREPSLDKIPGCVWPHILCTL